MNMKTAKEIRLHNARLLQDTVGGQKGMVEKTGRSQSQLSALMGDNAFKPIGNKIARSLEQTFAKPHGWLDTWHDDLNDRSSDANVTEVIPAAGMIPLISREQAGAFCEAVDNFQLGDAEQWLPCPVNVGKRAFALRVEGDSMASPIAGQRSYPEGTLIYVDPEKEPNNGSRVIAKLTDTHEVTFKVYAEDSGKRFLKPINPQYPTLELTDGTHICGVVVGSFMAE